MQNVNFIITSWFFFIFWWNIEKFTIDGFCLVWLLENTLKDQKNQNKDLFSEIKTGVVGGNKYAQSDRSLDGYLRQFAGYKVFKISLYVTLLGIKSYEKWKNLKVECLQKYKNFLKKKILLFFKECFSKRKNVWSRKDRGNVPENELTCMSLPR